MSRLRLGVLISGRGSNLQALIDACVVADFPAEIALVISNNADAAGLARAAAAGITAQVIDHREFAGREDFDAALDAALRTADVELVCLAGFMRLLSAGFVTAWRDRVINVHPSLLPAFPGLDAQTQALAAGARISGCTVHIVRPEMDSGPILGQAAVPVLADDDATTLGARILAQEHRLYPRIVRLIAERRVRIDGERVMFDAPADAAAALAIPAGP